MQQILRLWICLHPVQDSVHIVVYERVGGELYRTREHAALHPYCKYQHVFILAQSDIDADIGEHAETY